MTFGNKTAARSRGCARWLLRPPGWVEIAALLLFVAAIVGIRWYLTHLAPVYFWSKDSKSYVFPVVDWLTSGEWKTENRRGPIYSLFIAGVLSVRPSLTAVAIAQHILGGAAVFFSALAIRLKLGRAVWLPLLFCGLSYAIYNVPVYLEHLMRNETLIFLFASLAVTSLFLAFTGGSAGWMLAAGLSAGVGNLVKSVFVPFPLAVLLSVFVFRHDRRGMIIRLVAALLGFALPVLAMKAYYRLLPEEKEADAYSGIQLYGRVAQWTVLDGPEFAEIKALIRPKVEEYRAFDKLDNNWVIKRGIVPAINDHLRAQGMGFRDVNRVCKALAFETIRKNPGLYIQQVCGDLGKYMRLGFHQRMPGKDLLKENHDQITALKSPHPVFQHERAIGVLKEQDNPETFHRFHAISRWSPLFETWPTALVTSLLLPLLVVFSKKEARGFWIACSVMWFAYALLICTVGKPMQRYLLPMTPVTFFTLTLLLCHAWRAGLEWLGKDRPASRTPETDH
jgi:hypothetical protein